MINGKDRGPCVANTCVTNTCLSHYTNTEIPLHFTFNTPVNLVEDLNATPPAVQCGRVLFSDFHVQDAAEPDNTYPEHCAATCGKNSDCTRTCNNHVCPVGTAS